MLHSQGLEEKYLWWIQEFPDVTEYTLNTVGTIHLMRGAHFAFVRWQRYDAMHDACMHVYDACMLIETHRCDDPAKPNPVRPVRAKAKQDKLACDQLQLGHQSLGV
jgi:hypothetical protein